MHHPSEPVEPTALAEDDEEVVVTRIRDLLGLLGKTLRAFQMYEANNPVYQRFIDALKDGFASIWEVVTVLEFKVEESGFVRGGETYVVGDGREKLAFQFFKDGVRYLTFFPGFEDEVERFLDVVIRARQAITEEDDLVTLFWEQDFEAFQYGYVDVLAEGLEIPEAELNLSLEPVSSDAIAADVAAATEDAGQISEGAPAPLAQPGISPDDFHDTLYFLEDTELEALRREVEREWKDRKSVV